MTKEMAQMIVFDFSLGELYDNGYDNYSGRGMYGKKATGVVCDSPMYIISSIINNAELFVQEDEEEDEYQIPLFRAGDFRWDQFGKVVVIY